MPVLSTLLSGVNYIEEKQNQRKKNYMPLLLVIQKLRRWFQKSWMINIYKME